MKEYSKTGDVHDCEGMILRGPAKVTEAKLQKLEKFYKVHLTDSVMVLDDILRLVATIRELREEA